MAKRTTTEGGFVPPARDARYYLMDERRWSTYGEIVDGVAEDLRPRDREGLDLLLLAVGALSEAEMDAARELYRALIWAAERGADVPARIAGSDGFDDALPAVLDVAGRRGDALFGEATCE